MLAGFFFLLTLLTIIIIKTKDFYLEKEFQLPIPTNNGSIINYGILHFIIINIIISNEY